MRVCDMGSQHFLLHQPCARQTYVAILATATGVLATPIKTIAVIAPGIIIVDTHESQTRALGWLGIANSGSVVNSIRMSNGCLFVPVHIQSHQRTVSQVNTYPIYVYIYIYIYIYIFFFVYIYIYQSQCWMTSRCPMTDMSVCLTPSLTDM